MPFKELDPVWLKLKLKYDIKNTNIVIYTSIVYLGLDDMYMFEEQYLGIFNCIDEFEYLTILLLAHDFPGVFPSTLLPYSQRTCLFPVWPHPRWSEPRIPGLGFSNVGLNKHSR